MIDAVKDAVFGHLPARAVHAAASLPADIGSWFAASVPAGALINGLGLGGLAFLFARDLILTRAQHLRRVADIVAAQDRALVEKDQRITDLKHTADNRVADLNTAHAARVADLMGQLERQRVQYEGTVSRLIGERDYERTAKDIERKRADEAIQHVREMAQEYGATAVHLLQALDQISPARQGVAG